MTLDPNLPSQLYDENTLLARERTRLASERTFLAWIRTGLTGVGIGIAIARFLLFRHAESQDLALMTGRLLIIWGITIFIFALLSYQKNYKRLKQNQSDRQALLMVRILAIFLILLSIILFWIISI